MANTLFVTELRLFLFIAKGETQRPQLALVLHHIVDCPLAHPPGPFKAFFSSLFQGLLWSLWHHGHSVHTVWKHISSLASYRQARGVDVGMWSVDIKRGVFSHQGAGNRSRIVHYQASWRRCVSVRVGFFLFFVNLLLVN